MGEKEAIWILVTLLGWEMVSRNSSMPLYRLLLDSGDKARGPFPSISGPDHWMSRRRQPGDGSKVVLEILQLRNFLLELTDLLSLFPQSMAQGVILLFQTD